MEMPKEDTQEKKSDENNNQQFIDHNNPTKPTFT